MWHKALCSSRDYSGVPESGPCKRDEDGHDDGDVDEDDHRSDDSPPDGTPAPPRERRRSSPPCASSSMALPLDGERFFLRSLAFMAMMAPPRSSSMASGDDAPPKGCQRGPRLFFRGYSGLLRRNFQYRVLSGVLVFIGIFGVSLTSRGSMRQ